MEDLIWVRADNCFYSLMWPRLSQTNKESSHQILHLRRDPCQQNTLALFRFILLSIFPCVVGAHCWKVIVAIISRALAWGSSSQNSSCITQSFPRGMSEMCGKYNTALIFSWYCSDWLPACSGANKTYVYVCSLSAESDVRDDEVWQCLICRLAQHMLGRI